MDIFSNYQYVIRLSDKVAYLIAIMPLCVGVLVAVYHFCGMRVKSRHSGVKFALSLVYVFMACIISLFLLIQSKDVASHDGYHFYTMGYNVYNWNQWDTVNRYYEKQGNKDIITVIWP